MKEFKIELQKVVESASKDGVSGPVLQLAVRCASDVYNGREILESLVLTEDFVAFLEEFDLVSPSSIDCKYD